MKKIFISLMLLSAAISGMAETIVSGGKNRNIVVYAPADLPKGRPLLISMHGMNQDANYQKSQANYEPIADTAKFVVVYPDGENKGWDISGDKDINFLLDIISEMDKRYGIDQNRVYLSGFSMGGMMTYHAANRIADRIAAFAPCSGYPMGGPNAQSSRPIPLMHVHGTGDDVCIYGSVQSHLDAWVKRNGCNTTPKIEKPSTGPSNTTAQIYRYTGGQDGVEVAHLRLPGKGHWHSNDPAMAMTNVEVWRFLSQWSLASGPQIVDVSPEEGSFDMDARANNTFIFKLDHSADCGKVKCTMSDGKKAVTLALTETGFSNTLTFTLPSNAEVMNAEYRLQVRDLIGADGGKSPTYYYHYTFGVEEVGETMRIDTLLTQDWYSQQAAIGEGIPVGWHRVNSRSDGSKDEKLSGSANSGGARMKYFVPGGDIDAGFYFSSRDYDQCTFTYGDTQGYNLPLKRGHYCLSFRSAYWNEGARSNNVKFGVSVLRKDNGNALYSSTSLASSGCPTESTDRQLTGTKGHDIEFEVLQNLDYLLQYNISAGWDGVVLGPCTLTRCPSPADRYKGEYLRTLALAKSVLASYAAAANPDYAVQLAALGEVVGQVDGIVSILPSVYEAARLALVEAMKPLSPLALAGISSDATATMPAVFDLQGRPVLRPSRGMYVSGGKVRLVR